jgi:branched-chain amino acid transport system ATP-binding protein
LRQEGLGVLLVEQNLYSALALADRIYLIETGRIVHHGSKAELEADPSALQRYLGVH